MRRLPSLLLAFLLALHSAMGATPTPSESLVPNPDFSQPNEQNDGPAGWGNVPGMTWEIADGKRFVRIVSQEPGKNQMFYRLIPLKGAKGIEITTCARTSDIKVGSKPWFDARAIINFLCADGTKKSGPAIVFSQKSSDWTETTKSILVPEGATQIEFMAGLFMCAAGTVDLQTIRITPLSDEQIAALNKDKEAASAEKAKRQEEAEKKIDPQIDSMLAATGNLVFNGDFESDRKNLGWPEGWGKPSPGVTWEQDNGKHYMRMVQQTPGKLMMLYRITPLKTGVKAIEIKVRYRTEGVVNGTQMPGDARLVAHFLKGPRIGILEDGGEVKPEPRPIQFSSKAKDWTEFTRRCLVPPEATKLRLMPGLWFTKAGTVDISEIRVTPLSDEEAGKMAAEAAAAAKLKAEREAIIAQEMDKPAIAKELKVSGNRIVDATGKEIWLQGLCVDSMQWSTGDNILWSVHIALNEWKSNVIRIPVHDSFWFGHGKGQRPGSQEEYRQLVDKAAKLVAAKGAYLVLDLHCFGAPTEEHVAFWKDAAERYKNNPAVLYELFNEPHGVSWEIWRNGGSLSGPKNVITDVNPVENTEKMKTDITTGVQALVNTVRETGAKNIIIAGALDWAYDLSGIVNGYALDDKGGNGIVYVSHIYPWKKDWEKKVLVTAAKHPVIVTEIGTPPDYSSFSFIPAHQRYPIEGWSEDVLGMIQKYKLHWTGFSFHPQCGPMVIQDWNYTPTPYWGKYVKEALSGKQFEMKRMR